VTPSIAARIRWHAQLVGDLVRARSRYRRTGDWLVLFGVYGAHTLAGFLGMRTIRCRVPLPADTPPVTIRLGTADFHVVKELYLHEVYGFAVPALTALRPPVATVVDLGANIGLTVRLWSRLFSPRAIIAVEPDADNLALCARNAAPAATTQLTLVNCFVGDAPGVAGIDRGLGTWAYRMSRTEPAADQEAIPVRTLPEILVGAGFGSERIDLLKCDIEGAEAALFRGGPGWLSRVRAVLAEVHAPYTADEFAADVRASGGQWDAVIAGPAVLLVRR
jgi:FkbM family methyltransferase